MPPRVAILGAGPTGLEAALAASERGLAFTLYEASAQVAGHVRDWGHVHVFTPWDMNVSPRARAVLGDAAPAGPATPTGDELIERLYEPLAASDPLRANLSLGTRVRAVSRDGLLKSDEIGTGRRAEHQFRLLLERDGEESVERADIVIDCTGTYGNPNALGDGGIPAPGERAAAERGRVEYHHPREQRHLANRTILLTGSGHSAQTAARDLAELARHAPETKVVWAVRAPEPDFGVVSDDPLPARESLNRTAIELAGNASPAIELLRGRVTEAVRENGGGRLSVTLRNGALENVEVDHVLALNGGVGDFALYRQLQVHECYATAGPMKLAAALLASSGASCLEIPATGPETLVNPEPGFFILGAKSYGRNSQFLLSVGWKQVDDVFGSLLA